MLKVKIKKLHPDAVMPVKKSEGAAAFDVAICEDVTIVPGRQVIPLGIALEIPDGYEAKIEPRSGFSSKGMEGYEIAWPDVPDFVPDEEVDDYFKFTIEPRRYDADVIVGKIDSDYRGNIGVIINSKDEFYMRAGTRIAQMTFYKTENAQFWVTDELSDTERGEGGFGHTGC